VSTASQGKARYPGAGMHDGRCVVAARGVGVGGADATIGLRILTNSFALAHGTPLHHSRCAMQGDQLPVQLPDPAVWQPTRTWLSR
jgi:hypothetical protein